MRGHPVYRTIGIKKTGTFRGMRLPGSVPVFFRFLVHAAAPKEAGAIREMIEAEFKGIQIQMMDLALYLWPRAASGAWPSSISNDRNKKDRYLPGHETARERTGLFQVPGKRGGNWPLPPFEAGAIREMIEAEFKGIQIQMMDLSPVFVAQGGPGCVAIQYIER